MLQADQVEYRHETRTPLLDGVTCRIDPGEVVGLPGPSGCGKTTLGLLLSGYLQPMQGRILCDDSPLAAGGRNPVQMVFQHPDLAVNPRWQAGRIIAEGNPDAGELLTEFGIAPQWLRRYPHELSGGELQRITLIRAMHPATRYLIADELTASLDSVTQALIWHKLLAWARSHTVGILVISHDRKLLSRICDRLDEQFAPGPPRQDHSRTSPLPVAMPTVHA